MTFRTISLGYDTDDLELFKMGLYIGLFLGVFTGLIGALGCMWVLTKYDVVLQELEAMEFVDESQFAFIKKAGQQFDEVNTFNHKIAKQERIPIRGKHRAIEEWFFAKNAQ